MLFTLTFPKMPESPRAKQDLEEEAAKVEETPAASALHANTRVVKFDDFQSSFFPSRTGSRRNRLDSRQSDGSAP